MSKSFLLFSLGPVQEFIAASRKTQDLFAGSLLLSHLSKKAINTFCGKSALSLEKHILFPANTSSDPEELDPSIPNRFFADVSAITDSAAIKSIMAEVERAVNDEFIAIGNFARKKIEQKLTINPSDSFWDMLWKEQLENFIECYWAARISLENESYGDSYRMLEQLAGKRKQLRNFSAIIAQPFEKCTIIPNLSAVQPFSENRSEAGGFWEKMFEKFPGRIRKGEKLSAIALAKRFFPDYCTAHFKQARLEFPSTSTTAVSSFLEANKDEQLLRRYIFAVNEFTKKFDDIRSSNMPRTKDVPACDGDWFYEEAFDNGRLQKEFPEFQSDDRYLKDLSNLRKELFKIAIGNPSKYYAVIFFDGDNMGKWLSGAKCEISEDIHKNISSRLRIFSTNQEASGKIRNVYEIVEKEYLGKIIYSGGDDVIAFSCLRDALKAAAEIRKAFEEAMPKGRDGQAATGSAGIAIAHHQMNLQQVLQEARRAEHYAKETLGRDAFAVALLKRSGEHSLCGAKWQYGEFSATKLLSDFSGFIDRGDISTKFIYDLENERTGLEAVPEEAVRSEMKRLLSRHTAEEIRKKEEFKNLIKTMELMYTSLKNTGGKSSLKHFTELLMAAQFIGKGGDR